MSGPAVLVHTQLPTVKPSSPRYSDASSWVWVPCLEFPIERVNRLQFSSKPLKWIRYCIGAVTGAQGHLSRKADSLELVDYDQPLSSDSAESMRLYYHVSDAEKEHMFPTDPHLADPPKTNSVHSRASTTTSSVACEAFHQDLCERDTRCVAIGWDEMYCDAVHLVPHCKDDDYIKTLTTRRCRGREDDIVPAIDDVRNGVLLQAGLHKLLRQTLAFMPAPNFAMDSSDVVPGADPSEPMCIIHLFEPLQAFDIAGARLSMPRPATATGKSDWPPPVLFEAVYGAVVLHEFGVEAAHARVTSVWEDLYYPRGGFEATTAETGLRRRRARAQRAEAEAEAGGSPPPPTQKPDSLDLLLLVPYLAIPPNELGQYVADVERKAKAEERRSAEEKVNKWREGVPSSS
ncbi:hypothetical protein LXA43DRAFT_1091148 [Ganoderma leucocontextum]|nr:hypothetical protein LXA43DRAFT_1091148 [Ganoderma leucocontextum]